MATWRKVIVSGSSAVLNQISASGNIVPISDNGSDLGSSTREWKDLYIDGTANVDSLVADTADINAGTVDAITSLTAAGNLDIGAHGFRANTLTADAQTSGRVAIYSTAGLLSEDSDLTFSGDTLTATKVSAGTNFTVDGLVLTADTITNDAALEVVSTGLTLNASLDIALSADGGNVTMDDGTITIFDFNVDDTSLTIHDDQDTGDTAVITMAQHGALSIVTTDDDAAAANIQITADGTAELAGTTVTLDSGANVVLSPAGGSHVKIDDVIQVDSGIVIGATSITSTNFVGIIGASGAAAGTFTTLDCTDGAFALDNLDIDGGTDINAAIVAGDLIIVDDGAGGTNRKSTINRVATLFAGDGLQASSAVMAVDVSDFAGDGLRDEGSENLAVDVSDFAGTGIEDDGSENLRLATQGTGISGGNGSTLSITPAQTAITSVKNDSLVVGYASSDDTINFGSGDVTIEIGGSEKFGVTSAGVDVTGALTVSTNATIEGNLIVNGDTTTLSTTNLAVGDQFIFAATGSAGTNVDAGIIVQSGSAVDSGSAIYHDINSERWAVATGVSSIAQAVTPGQMVTTTTLSTSEPGSSDGDYGVGEMWVDTDDQTIWVRTA